MPTLDMGFPCTQVGAPPGEPRRYRRGLVQRRAMTYFERQPKMAQSVPKATGADLRVMLRGKPALQLGKRRIGLAHHMGAKGAVMCGKLRFGATGPRTRTRLPRPLPPPQGFVDIGNTNPEERRRNISARSRFNRRHYPSARPRCQADPARKRRRFFWELYA